MFSWIRSCVIPVGLVLAFGMAIAGIGQPTLHVRLVDQLHDDGTTNVEVLGVVEGMEAGFSAGERISVRLAGVVLASNWVQLAREMRLLPPTGGNAYLEIAVEGGEGDWTDVYMYADQEGTEMLNLLLIRNGLAAAKPPYPGYERIFEAAELARLRTTVRITGINACYPELVQIRNMGRLPVDLSGWYMREDSGYFKPPAFRSVVLNPGCELRVYVYLREEAEWEAALADAAGTCHHLVWLYRRPILNMKGDTVYLFTASGDLVDLLACSCSR